MTRTAAPSPATNPAQRFPRSLLLPMMIGCILNPINSSIIAVALIPIGAFFCAPPSQTTWLVSALYVATAIGQPLTGRLVDRYGPKRLFLIGSGLVGIAGVIGMLAPNLWVLVVARVILGFGTCAGYPSAMALIRKVSDRQGIISPAGVLTALTVTTQTISVIGPTLGGVLIDVGGWRATLAINVPLAIAALLLGWFLLPAYADEGTSSGGAGIDWGGIGLFCGMLIALLVFLMNLRMAFAWALVVAIVVGVGFVLRERRTDDPFIDLRMLAGNRPLIATYVRGFAMSTVSYSFLYGVSQWVEEGRGLTPSQTGLMLLPTFGTAIVFSAVFGRKPHLRANLLVGSLIQVIVCIPVLFVHATTPVWLLVIVLVLLGIPQGLVGLSNQNVLYLQTPADQIGASSGLLRTFQYIGAIGASAAAGICFGTSASTDGVHELAAFMLVIAAVGFVLVIADRTLATTRFGAATAR